MPRSMIRSLALPLLIALACGPGAGSETGPSTPTTPDIAEAPVDLGPEPDRKDVAVGNAPFIGGAEAAITVVEFSDFQCGYCGRMLETIYRIRDTYGDEVKIAFKHFPLPIHPKAPMAHVAAEAAHRQGKFWEMHDLIFKNPRKLDEDQYLAYAGALGLDIEQFQKDRASRSVRDQVIEDAGQAYDLGITGTPAFFVNGRLLAGALPFEEFQKTIDDELRRIARSEGGIQSALR